MLIGSEFYSYLQQKGIEFTTGVPDSLLKEFCAFISDQGNDIIAANEGASIGIAAGYHLATGKIPMVYMQNSGFGNTINPLTSLADKEVYSIPMLLVIGWRGEPGVKDEPQHVKQGRVSADLLDTLEIPYEVLSNDINEAQKQIDKAVDYMSTENAPFALLIRKNTFEKYSLKNKKADIYPMQREDAIKVIIDECKNDEIIVSTTGKTSREVFECRVANGQGHENDFLTVGSMGHASQIALGIALQKPNKSIICLDGDGAMLMHLGSTAIIGDLSPANYKHILVNNGAHDSVGGQPTVGFDVNFQQIAEACNYKKCFTAESEAELKAILPEFLATAGPVMLEVKTSKGARADLGRPTKTPTQNKADFMKKLSE